MIKRAIFLAFSCLVSFLCFIHLPYDFISPTVTSCLAEQNDEQTSSLVSKKSVEENETVVDGSITTEKKQSISDECGWDKDCIDKKCIKLFPDKRVHSIHCYAEVREYQKERAPPSKWMVSRSTSKMDDSKTIVIILEAENYISGWPDKSVLPKLFIRCRENKTEILINVGMSSNPEYGHYNEATVRVRLDNNKPFKQRWSESTNHEALFAPKGIALARKINKSDTMIFEFTPYNSHPQLIEFDIRGLEPDLKELAETCNWKL